MMKACALGVSIALGLAFGAFAQQGRPTLTRSDIAAGRMVAVGGAIQHTSIACVQCHGIDGEGDSSGAFPRLAGLGGWYLYKSLKDYAAGLRRNEAMMSVARDLTETQIRDVAAYYASLKREGNASSGSVDPQTLQLGGAISAVGIPRQGVPPCAGCHGRNGVSESPIYPMLAGQHELYTRLQLLAWKEGKRDGDPMNIMQQIAASLTDKQISAVAAYFALTDPAVASGNQQSGRHDRQQSMPPYLPAKNDARETAR